MPSVGKPPFGRFISEIVGRVRGGRNACASQGMVFVEEGWENSLTLQITLSPQRQRLLPVFTRVLSPLQPCIRTCQREQGLLSQRGIATLALCPPGHCWQPLITGVMWACQPDHTEGCVNHSVGKVSKTLASGPNVGIFLPTLKSFDLDYIKNIFGNHLAVKNKLFCLFVLSID